MFFIFNMVKKKKNFTGNWEVVFYEFQHNRGKWGKNSQ